MAYHVIALDLDGTLLTPQKTILPETVAALQEAQQQGKHVLLVTGRHHITARPYHHSLSLRTPAICCNGTYLYDFAQQQVLEADPLRHDQASQICDLMAHWRINGMLYGDNVMLYEHPEAHVRRFARWTETLPDALKPQIIHTPSLKMALQDLQAVWKFALASADTALLHAFAQDVEQQLGITGEWSWEDQVDFAQIGNSKGQRLQRWVEAQGLSMENVIAFGDNHNDLSMLTRAGLGVAMGNSEEAIRQQADLITTSNSEPGIAAVLREYVL